MRSRRAAAFLDRDGALRHGYWHRGNQFMIGDRETDMECGRRAGVAQPFFQPDLLMIVGRLLATKMKR